MTRKHISVHDIYSLLTFIENIERKRIKEIEKRLHLCRNKYPPELIIATRVFTSFFKMMVEDVITQRVSFYYTKVKSISLLPLTYPPMKQVVCRKNKLLPSMPLYYLAIKDGHLGKMRVKLFVLYNELQKLLMDGNREGILTLGIKEGRRIPYYLPKVQLLFPELTKFEIEQIIRHGLRHIFILFKQRDILLQILEFTPYSHKLLFFTNKDTKTNLFAKNKLSKNESTIRNESYYIVLTDEQKKLIESGVKEIETEVVCGMNLVRLHFKSKMKVKYKHVYKIKETHYRSYGNLIWKLNVETSRLEYVYRRTYHRFKPVNVAE